MPKVSVIIPVFNCAPTLGKAIESAQNQTLRDIEIIAVDDCSTDESYAIVQSFADTDPRIVCGRLPENGGASVARNAAIGMATGEWIAVLDADDWYEPERLEILMKAARDFQADLVCDNLKIYDHVRQEVVDETRHGQRGRIAPLTAEILFRSDSPLCRHAIGYVKPVVRRAFLQTHNIAYDPVHRAGQDFVFLAETILKGARGFMVPGAYYVYVHRISPTTRKISPHSRSDAGFALIVQGCDELMRKYGASMMPAARRALQRRRWIFESRVMCGDMLVAIRQKRYSAATLILLSRPFILALVGNTLAKWLYANMLFFWRRQRKRSSAMPKA